MTSMISDGEVTCWQTCATAWELLALSFRYPDVVLAQAVASGEWVEAAVEVADALDLELPEDFDAGVAAGEPDTLLHTLRAEATRLFVGAPDPVVSPYEGVHRAADDGVQALLFVNPHSMAVERFMKSCGLGRPEGTNEPLDHVATECELLQYLATLAAGAKPPAHITLDALPGGSPEEAYATFLAEHAQTWLARFAEAVAAETRESFYRAAAHLLHGVAIV